MAEQFQGLKDTFTGFHSKLSLMNYLEKRIASVAQEKMNLSLIILDLDHFKSINDKYGHVSGDDALRHFVKVLKVVLNGQHFVARYGGDEFVIIMYGNQSDKDALKLSSDFQEALRINTFKTKGKEVKISASVGVVSTRGQINTARDLLEKADQALYTAKKSGRGREIAYKDVGKQKKFLTFQLIGKVLLCLAVLGGLAFGINELRKTKAVKDLFRPKFYYVELNNGRSLEAWLVEETDEMLMLSFKKPHLNVKPPPSAPRFDQIFRVPKEEIFEVVKNQKLQSGSFHFGVVQLKNQKSIHGWLIDETADDVLMTFKKPASTNALMTDTYEYTDPIIFPKEELKAYILYN